MTDSTSDLFEISRAIGIGDGILERWNRSENLPNIALMPPSKAAARARFDIDGPILDTLTCTLFGLEEGVSHPKALREFLDANEGADIDLVINSPGGSVFAAYSMRGDLMRHEGFVNVYVNGLCASAATYFLALPNSHRVAMPATEVMIHNAVCTARGDYRELMKAAERMQKTNETFAVEFEAMTNLSKEVLLEMMQKETWFDPEEALRDGLVDEIYTPSEAVEQTPDEEEMKEEMPAAILEGEKLKRLQVARIFKSDLPA